MIERQQMLHIVICQCWQIVFRNMTKLGMSYCSVHTMSADW